MGKMRVNPVVCMQPCFSGLPILKVVLWDMNMVMSSMLYPSPSFLFHAKLEK